MDRAYARTTQQRSKPAPASPPKQETRQQRELLELQRMAGNRAVVEALTTVQRHRLDPETMDEE